MTRQSARSEDNLNIVPTIGHPLRVALCLIACGSFAHAAGIVIYGDVADSEVNSTGIFSYDPGSLQGEVGVNGGYDYSDVFVFQLPVLLPGQLITAADFSFYDDASSSVYNIDLYGLAYRSASTVLPSDWYSGPSDPNSHLIQGGIIPPSVSFSGRITTSNAADAALLAYLNAQYAAGAAGGNYVFLRLSNSVINGANTRVDFLYNADVAPYLEGAFGGPSLSYWQDLYSPRLDVTLSDVNVSAAPEPSSMALLAGGLGVCVLLKRRSQSRARSKARLVSVGKVRFTGC
jgi:hypothetical protein